jgi:hypothetical protein
MFGLILGLRLGLSILVGHLLGANDGGRDVRVGFRRGKEDGGIEGKVGIERRDIEVWEV